MRALLPFLLQGLLMGVDELYFHRRRRMRRWERLGHPIDTALFLLCLGLLWALPPVSRSLWIYGIAAAVSCLVITKDEWEHHALCAPTENWLHALLFILHPVLLGWAGYLWWTSAADFKVVMGMVPATVLGFGLYQLLYWNLWRHDQQ
jgi:hypothetical protein